MKKIVKGENVRLFFGERCVASAKSCTVNLNVNTEDDTDKDSTGMWEESEPTSLSWDGSMEAAMVLTDPISGGNGMLITDLVDLIISSAQTSTPVHIKFCQTEENTANNRTIKTSGINREGDVWLTNYSTNPSAGQKVSYSVQFKGTGPFKKVGASDVD